MTTLIKYNNHDFKDLDLSTPDFSRSISEIIYGEKRGIKESISLDGQVYIKEPPLDCDYFSLLTTKRDQLLNIFSEDYKTLVIMENGVTILQKDFCKIITIDFPESPNRKVIEYSIQIECIDEEFHNEFFGIQDPVNSTSFSLSGNGHYSISREVSAKGLKTSGTQAIQNAIDFVESNSGKSSIDLSIIEDGLQLYLKSKSEKIDRVKNTFSISEDYISDKNDKTIDNGVLTYTVESNKNSGSIHEVTVSGNISFGIDEDFNKARNRIKEIDFYSLAQKSEIQNLLKKPVSSSINENEKGGSIDFSIAYNNDTTFDECGVSREYNFSISEVGNKITCSVSGVMKARGPIASRWPLIKEKFYSEEINNIFQEAQDNVSSYFNGITLNQNSESKVITENEKMGEVRFELSFSNKNKISNFKSFNYNINVELSVPNISIDMNFGGNQDSYIASRGGFTKPIISVSANGEYIDITRDQAKIKIKEKVEEVINQAQLDFIESNLQGITKSENVDYSKNKNLISLNKTVEYFSEPKFIGKAT